jgi:hypothetical protein
VHDREPEHICVPDEMCPVRSCQSRTGITCGLPVVADQSRIGKAPCQLRENNMATPSSASPPPNPENDQQLRHTINSPICDDDTGKPGR